MDPLAALQEELKKKKSSVAAARASNKRWRSQADIEHERAQNYLRTQRQLERERAEAKRRKLSPERSNAAVKSSEQRDKDKDKDKGKGKEEEEKGDSGEGKVSSKPPLSKDDVVRKLRALNLPVTYYGEDEWARYNRLREAQLAAEDVADGQDNVYQKKLRALQAQHESEDRHNLYMPRERDRNVTGTQCSTEEKDKDKEEEKVEDEKDTKKADVKCKEEYVRGEIERYMKLWADEISAMSSDERRNKRGRNATVTLEQTKEWLSPLLHLLRKRKVARSILNGLRDILHAAGQREYIVASRLYLEKLAIGNAPWPMGATQVGIHSRIAREKIGEDRIAHVMNDDQTRKYIQAVKRLLTVAQRHFPTDPSKMAST